MNDFQGNSFDVPFTVPFTHRLRTTGDLFGADQQVLLDLLEGSGERPPRVQFWLDQDVATANPELKTAIDSFRPRREHALRTGGECAMRSGW